jgi:hypothetical protein
MNPTRNMQHASRLGGLCAVGSRITHHASLDP